MKNLIYDRWCLVYLIVGVLAIIFSIWHAVRCWRTKPERRTGAAVSAVLICAIVAAFALRLPATLQSRMLSRYYELFRAERVEYDGADVTDLFAQHAGDCWAYTQMEDFKPEKDAGTVCGELRFYRENGREFQKIDVVRLTQPVDSSRVYEFDGGYYVFSAADWENKGYVYGFDEALAQQLLGALPD